jgi:type IV pilus biogenesis protein CpaD/CtpE
MCPVIVEEMTDFILHAMLKELDDIESDKDRENLLRAVLNKDTSGKEMYILTNKGNMNGAFAAFQAKELAELADQIGVNKLYILPSSMHELITVPAKGIEHISFRKW